MPRHKGRLQAGKAKRRVQSEPQGVLENPEQHQGPKDPGLPPPGGPAIDQESEVKHKGHEQENPDVVPGQGPAAPEHIQQRVLFHAPGRKSGGPTGGAFNLNLHLGEYRRQQHQACQYRRGTQTFAFHGVCLDQSGNGCNRKPGKDVMAWTENHCLPRGAG